MPHLPLVMIKSTMSSIIVSVHRKLFETVEAKIKIKETIINM